MRLASVVRLARRRSSYAVALGLLAASCAASVPPGPRWSAPARGPKTETATNPDPPASGRFDREVAARFGALRAQYGDLTYPALVQQLPLARAPEVAPGFDPTRADYYRSVRDAMELTAEEQEIYRRQGVVGVDHLQRYSMGSAYLAIYRRDLPVLITTDSILHALHRSFDNILIEIETARFAPEVSRVLGKVHQRLREAAAGLTDAKLRRSLQDVDIYLTVARNLLLETRAEQTRYLGCLSGSADPSCEADPTIAALSGELEIPSLLGQDAKVKEVLAAIVKLQAGSKPSLYGRSSDVYVDWSQFAPRGHYTKSPRLRHYFRAMMWLGRVDLGFVLAQPDAAFGGHDVDRELRDAAALAWLLRDTGELKAVDAIDRALALLVGLSDDFSVARMAAVGERAGLRALADLARPETLAALRAEIGKAGGGGQGIRSQIGLREPGGGPEKPLPEVMQVLGQRFVIDSFVLSKVVFDSIQFQGVLQKRMLPSGLDAMAALGNDEAVALLEPALRDYKYSANLLSARRVVEERPPARWAATLYDLWLGALARLDDVGPQGELPQVMRGRAWQRKQLQTQLGSWAELRHDTILYAKQSYTMGVVCEYPTGYVEPYPELYAQLALFAEHADQRLGEVLQVSLDQVGPFLRDFAATMHKLEGLARKELAAQSFTREERQFVKETIQARTEDEGCGPPTVIYSGWYPKLIYGGGPEQWEPTIADVHTDPNTGQVLEVGVGDVNFVVVAIDNRGDRATYVGPIYSYYEFPSHDRLTDETWRAQIQDGKAPARPEWTRAFQATPARRNLKPPSR